MIKSRLGESTSSLATQDICRASEQTVTGANLTQVHAHKN